MGMLHMRLESAPGQKLLLAMPALYRAMLFGRNLHYNIRYLSLINVHLCVFDQILARVNSPRLARVFIHEMHRV